MKKTKKEEEEERALLEKEKEKKKGESEKPEEPEKPAELSDAVTKVYKHNFANCHLTLSPPEVTGTQSIVVVLQKPTKKPWGYYRTADEEIQKLIEKSPYFGRKSGFRILEASETEAKKGEDAKPRYKTGVLSGVK